MASPIMERLQQNGINPQTQQTNPFQVNPELVEMYKTYKTASNPEALMDRITNKIPVIGQIRSGGNMKEKFYQLCEEQGINPDLVLSQFK